MNTSLFSFSARRWHGPDTVCMSIPKVITVSQEIAEQINSEYQLAYGSAASYAQHAVRCGYLLLEQKKRSVHGAFGPWLKCYCPNIGRSTVARWMKAAEVALEGGWTPENPNFYQVEMTLRGVYLSGRAKQRTREWPNRHEAAVTKALEVLRSAADSGDIVARYEAARKARWDAEHTLHTIEKELIAAAQVLESRQE
jgi:hypothetical protein